MTFNVREKDAYREKKVQSDVRAIQVIGTVRLGLGQGTDRSRFILARATVDSSSLQIAHCM